MIDYDCRPRFTDEINRLNNKGKHVIILGPGRFGGATALKMVYDKIVNSSSAKVIPIYLEGLKNKTELLKQITFCVDYPTGFKPKDDKIRNRTIDALLNKIENSNNRFCILFEHINRVSEESARSIAEICNCKNVNLLASAYSMKTKSLQRLTSELKLNPLVRKLPPVKNSILKELFDRITEKFPVRKDKRYKAIRSKAVKAANRSPGELAKLSEELKEKDVEESMEFFEEAINQVSRREVYIKPIMIVLPIMGFSIAFCMAKFGISIAGVVRGLISAGLCLSTYRFMVGWGGKD